jgi:hypothetical protein
VEEFERSKLTQDSFASRREIPATTLRSWIYKLRRERKASVSLVPVRVIASAPAAREADTAVIEVELRTGVQVRFSTGADLDYVAALVQRLG